MNESNIAFGAVTKWPIVGMLRARFTTSHCCARSIVHCNMWGDVRAVTGVCTPQDQCHGHAELTGDLVDIAQQTKPRRHLRPPTCWPRHDVCEFLSSRSVYVALLRLSLKRRRRSRCTLIPDSFRCEICLLGQRAAIASSNYLYTSNRARLPSVISLCVISTKQMSTPASRTRCRRHETAPLRSGANSDRWSVTDEVRRDLW